MKASTTALAALLATASSFEFALAFTPSTLVPSRTAFSRTTWYKSYDVAQLCAPNRNSSTLQTRLFSSAGFLDVNDDEDDEDGEEDDEDDDDIDLATSSSYASTTMSPVTGLTMDPWDPNPIIKPRPSRFFAEDDKEMAVPDDQLVQALSGEERTENLSVMRTIQKNDLPDLRMRKDHAGWVEANNDLKKRKSKDPWYALNERLKDAIQYDQGQEKVDHIKSLISKIGGNPTDIPQHPRGYAVHSEIYDLSISPNRANAVLERQVREERSARGKAMMAERNQNIEKEKEQYEEDLKNPGLREDREAKERRERTMRRVMGEIEEDNKKKRERAKEILGRDPETPDSRTASMDKALEAARQEVKNMKRQQRLGAGKTSAADDATDSDDTDRPSTDSISETTSSADKARQAAAAEASGGRPRLPGDRDVTLGELPSDLSVESSSSTTTGPLQVEVTSTYNKEQSDPPMRKHCFQYTIRITNNSETGDTIQLLGRRFEIQTVGSSMKDVVSGEGVTGRQPILKPGEVFEYTSTAPLSVRPIGTTIIAARMRGEYRYMTLESGQETATPEQTKAGGDASADLGVFHFVFPEEQRVQPFSRAEEDDEEDDDDDDDDVVSSSREDMSTASAAAAVPKSTPSAAPASTLPGDEDMKTGDLTITPSDASDTLSEEVRVQVSSSYRPERSDPTQEKHCFAYNIRITNENTTNSIQLVSRRFEIQTIGSTNKDVVQGPGVTGRQPILKPGESFEYTSTAPLSVRPLQEKTPVVARMQGEYNFVQLADDGSTPMSSTPLKAELGEFHFILPALDTA